MTRLTIVLLVFSFTVSTASATDKIYPNGPSLIPCNWGTLDGRAMSVGVFVPGGDPGRPSDRVWCGNVDAQGEARGIIISVTGSSHIVKLDAYAYGGADCTGLASTKSNDHIIVYLTHQQMT